MPIGGVCLVIKGLYLITSGLYFVVYSTYFVPQSSNFVPISSNILLNFVSITEKRMTYKVPMTVHVIVKRNDYDWCNFQSGLVFV